VDESAAVIIRSVILHLGPDLRPATAGLRRGKPNRSKLIFEVPSDKLPPNWTI